MSQKSENYTTEKSMANTACQEEQLRQKLINELAEVELAKKNRHLNLPLIKEATAKMEWLNSTGCGASEGAAAVLKYCYKGWDNDTLKYADLERMDTNNTELALLLINTVAKQKYLLPKEYLSSIGKEILQQP